MRIAITEDKAVKLKEMWESGVPSRDIQITLDLKAATISQHVRRNKLTRPDGVSARTNLVLLSNDEFVCSKCNTPKHFSAFQRNNVGNFYGFCRSCRQGHNLDKVHHDSLSWIKGKLKAYKHRSEGKFDLDADYLKWVYDQQSGLCFYSDYALTWGHNPESRWLATSVDKVIPSRGYVKGNVVLAQCRINSAKSDFTLDEMKRWMPEWHRRIAACQWLKVLETC
jgi:hypothetical protein